MAKFSIEIGSEELSFEKQPNGMFVVSMLSTNPDQCEIRMKIHSSEIKGAIKFLQKELK